MRYLCEITWTTFVFRSLTLSHGGVCCLRPCHYQTTSYSLFRFMVHLLDVVQNLTLCLDGCACHVMWFWDPKQWPRVGRLSHQDVGGRSVACSSWRRQNLQFEPLPKLDGPASQEGWWCREHPIDPICTKFVRELATPPVHIQVLTAKVKSFIAHNWIYNLILSNSL